MYACCSHIWKSECPPSNISHTVMIRWLCLNQFWTVWQKGSHIMAVLSWGHSIQFSHLELWYFIWTEYARTTVVTVQMVKKKIQFRYILDYLAISGHASFFYLEVCSRLGRRGIGKIRLIEGNAKCHLNKSTCKMDFSEGIYLSEAQNPIPYLSPSFPTYCSRVQNTVHLFTQERGENVGEWNQRQD